MNEILFLFFAFFTVFLSIRLSYYADKLSRTSGVSSAFIGGVLLAGVTSLPEFVTCFSAVFVGNNALAVGDILGSNIFNYFMICFFDLYFVRKMLFCNVTKSFNVLFAFLIINYFILYLFIKNIFSFSISFIGVPTLFIFVTYGIYVFIISRSKDDTVCINDSSGGNITLKLFVTAVFMVFSSIILTVIVNKIAFSYPSFSSSFLGAIFLGITTSLPEVITCYTLINMNSYDLAVSDIIGSNFFNLLVIAIGDLIVKNGSIYSFSDKDEAIMICLGFMFTIICYLCIRLKSYFSKTFYGILSLLVVVMYLSFWILNFLY